MGHADVCRAEIVRLLEARAELQQVVDARVVGVHVVDCREAAVACLVSLAGLTRLLTLASRPRTPLARPQHHALLHALQSTHSSLLLRLVPLTGSGGDAHWVHDHVALAERARLLLRRELSSAR